MRFLRQYGGLRREMYVVFFGRVVTNMGALIWPMLTETGRREYREEVERRGGV